MSKRKGTMIKKSKFGPIYFVVGTRAQFVKVAPLMKLMKDRSVDYTFIYTAQHKENMTDVLREYGIPDPDITLYDREEANTRQKFISWFFSVFPKAVFRSRKYLPEKGIVLTHGDTFTTWIAAVMGKLAGCKVAHLESGYRSFNLLRPFPEELSRVVTFFFSDVYFCANDQCVENVRKFKGDKVNTVVNSAYDGVRFALDRPSKKVYDFERSKYAVVSIHRSENIFSKRLEEYIVPKLIEISKKQTLLFVLHPTTRERLKGLGLYDKLSDNPKIIMHERFVYTEFVNILNRAEFVINDGGSIQQELSYLGVPTILFRTETETKEGLGENVVLSKLDDKIIDEFVENYKSYRRPFMDLKHSPSEVVLNYLVDIK